MHPYRIRSPPIRSHPSHPCTTHLSHTRPDRARGSRVNLRTGNYNFRFRVPFFPVFFVVRPACGGGGDKTRDMLDFLIKTALVCAKWYDLFFLISLRGGGRIIYHVFFCFPVVRFRMGWILIVPRNECLIGARLMCNKLKGRGSVKGFSAIAVSFIQMIVRILMSRCWQLFGIYCERHKQYFMLGLNEKSG